MLAVTLFALAGAQSAEITDQRPIFRYIEQLREEAESPIAFEDAVYAPRALVSITCPALDTTTTDAIVDALETCVALENAARTCGQLAVHHDEALIRVHAVNGLDDDGTCIDLSEHPLDINPAPIGVHVEGFGRVRVEDANLMETFPAAGPWRPSLERARLRQSRKLALSARTRYREGEWTYSLSLRRIVPKPPLTDEERAQRDQRIEALHERVEADFQQWLDAGQPEGPLESEWESPEP